MPRRQDQFSFQPEPIKGSREEPRLWVKEFGFFSDFKAEAEVRRITLRRGLNIIWAKESEEGASGHAAGKSTFCRLLRYMLGDVSFGSEDFRFALRDKFPEAILLAEVILDDHSWLLCRSLSDHGYHWAAIDQNYEDTFSADFKKEPYKNFQDKLQATFIAPLGITHYPGSRREIEWLHLLQWLTRDQDARYAGPLLWRPGGESKTSQASEKVNLVRLVLGVLGQEEVTKQGEHAELLKEKGSLKSQQPLLTFSRNRTLSRIQNDFPKLRKDNDLAFELEAQLKDSRNELSAAKTAKEKTQNSDGLDDILREALKNSRSKRDNAQRRLNATARDLQSARNAYNYRNKKLSKEEYRAAQAKLPPSEGRCSHLREVAQAFECPLTPPPDRDEIAAERLEATKDEKNQAQDKLTQLEKSKSLDQRELDAAKAQLKPFKEREEKAKEAHVFLKKSLDEKVEHLQLLISNLEQIEEDDKALQEGRTRLEQLEITIKQSTDDLKTLRKTASSLRQRLTDDFNLVATHLTKQIVDGAVEFQSETVNATMNYDGDESSAALITLRLLIFDLAALLGSVRDTSHHPGFLLHDSPREADLSVHIYRRLFTLISGTDGQAENESVQYIIATTEAPPAHLQKKPWLACAPLSSDSPKSRFLKTIV